MTPQDFGNFIRTHRIEKKLGLRAAAAELDISPGYLSRLETNQVSPPSGTQLQKIAQLYGVGVEELWVRARSRSTDPIAADVDTAPIVAAFYRLAKDQTEDVQKSMLEAAINAIDIDDDAKAKLKDQLDRMVSRLKSKDLPRRAKNEDGLFAFDIKPRFLSRANIEIRAEQVLATHFGKDPEQWPWGYDIAEIAEFVDDGVRLVVSDDTKGGTLKNGSPAILGMSRWSACGMVRELVIHEDLFDAEQSSLRRRGNFTIAHELFHCLEHLPLVEDRVTVSSLNRAVFDVSLPNESGFFKPWHEQGRSKRRFFTDEDWREWQANQFASSILMPRAKVEQLFFENFEDGFVLVDSQDDVDEVADEVARSLVELDAIDKQRFCDVFNVNPQPMAIRLKSLGLVQSSSKN